VSDLSDLWSSTSREIFLPRDEALLKHACTKVGGLPSLLPRTLGAFSSGTNPVLILFTSCFRIQSVNLGSAAEQRF
jgi:hypothetical protein